MAVKTMTHGGYTFYFGWHFAVLAGLATALVSTGDWIPVQGPLLRFGVYGALYSAALAITLRKRANCWRRLVFPAQGALLSAANAALGLSAGRLVHALPGSPASLWVLAGSAGLGAAAYALLVRAMWVPRLTAVAPVVVALACMLAVLAVTRLRAVAPMPGVWLVVAWWFTFSLTLWYQEWRRDRRH